MDNSPFLQPIRRADHPPTIPPRPAPQSAPEPPVTPPRPAPQPAPPSPPNIPPRTYPGPSAPRRNRARGKKNTKASLKVSALNIKGRGNPNVLHDDNKWYHIWQTVREQKIGVLIVGEAHLDDNHKHDVDQLFGRVIRLEFTPDTESPSARAGLAFVLNKKMVKTEDVKTYEIIPCRAMLLEMENVDGTTLSVLGVYAPNRPYLNGEFWRKIREWLTEAP
ncbi:hypothetical protein R3P38DRAFT_2582272, partial [Favolaschia claudopus]